MGGSPLAALIASEDAAYALAALYLGMEMLAKEAFAIWEFVIVLLTILLEETDCSWRAPL